MHTNRSELAPTKVVGMEKARVTTLLMIALSLGCAHGERASGSTPSSVVATRASSACSASRQRTAHARSEQTILAAYRREGGAWLDSLPLLINEDFDMALAMSLEGGVGAGLAAAQRRDSNRRKAAALEGVALEATSGERLAALHCCGMDVYFLLWGGEEAKLDMVVDVIGDARASRVVAGPMVSLSSGKNALARTASELLRGLTCGAAVSAG